MNRRTWVLLGCALACLHGAAGLWFCWNGLLNADEAFYGLAAREATAGAVPYRDFGFTQFPLVPYAHGLVMRVIGFGFFEQRLAAGLWAAATAALGARWLARRHSGIAAAWFAALLATSAGWMYNVHLGKTYAVTGFFVLAMSVAVLSDLSPRSRTLWLAALGALALGCRLPIAPVVAVLWLQNGWAQRGRAGLALAIIAPVIATALVLAPFYAADPENFWFWTIGFHHASVALRNFYVVPSELWGLAPALWLGVAATAGGLIRRKTRPPTNERWLAAALLAGLLANVAPRGGYAEYAAPLVPAALLLVTVIAARHWPSLALPSALAAIVVALVSGYVAPPPTDSEIHGQVQRSARALRAVLPAAAEFNGPATLLALETGHRIDRRLIMTPFSFVETNDEAWAAKHHLATPAWLTARMQDPALPVYALTNQRRWNFGRSMPDYRLTSPAVLQGWASILERDYARVEGADGFAIFVRGNP